MKTAQGLIRLTPQLASRSLKILLIKGAKLTVMLQPSSREPDTWELVGACYIRGLMDGKLWDMLEGNCECSGKMWDMYQDSSLVELWLS